MATGNSHGSVPAADAVTPARALHAQSERMIENSSISRRRSGPCRMGLLLNRPHSLKQGAAESAVVPLCRSAEGDDGVALTAGSSCGPGLPGKDRGAGIAEASSAPPNIRSQRSGQNNLTSRSQRSPHRRAFSSPTTTRSDRQRDPTVGGAEPAKQYVARQRIAG